MSRVPYSNATGDVQESFREVWQAIDPVVNRNWDIKGRRIINAGRAQGDDDLLTLGQAKMLFTLQPTITAGGRTTTIISGGPGDTLWERSSSLQIEPVAPDNVRLDGYLTVGGDSIKNSDSVGYVPIHTDVTKLFTVAGSIGPPITGGNEARGVNGTMRVGRTAADEPTAGWDIIGGNFAGVITAANTKTIIGKNMGVRGEVFADTPSSGSYLATYLLGTTGSVSSIGTNVTVTYAAGILVSQPNSGPFGSAGAASRVTNGYGIWLQDQDDFSHAYNPTNACAIKIDGIDTYGRIKWTGIEISCPTSGTLHITPRADTDSRLRITAGNGAAGRNADIIFRDNATDKWQILKTTNNDFKITESGVADRIVFTYESDGTLPGYTTYRTSASGRHRFLGGSGELLSYIYSPATNDSRVRITTGTTGKNADIVFADGADTDKWQILKTTNNDFKITESGVADRIVLTQSSDGGSPGKSTYRVGVTTSGGGSGSDGGEHRFENKDATLWARITDVGVRLPSNKHFDAATGTAGGGYYINAVAVLESDGSFVYLKTSDGTTCLSIGQGTHDVAVVDGFDAVDIGASGAYYVDGTKVVGNQGAAVADADGSLASATSQLNALLARCRAHGLIAT